MRPKETSARARDDCEMMRLLRVRGRRRCVAGD